MDRPEDTPASQAGSRLALIDTFERDGRTGRVLDVRAWPLLLGRGMDSDVVLEDPFVAERHARIGPDADGRLLLTVLDTVNGVELNGRRVRAGSSVPLPEPGQPCTVQLGQTRLRLRLAGAPVPAELPLPLPQRSPLWLAVPLYALLLADLALGLDPGADTSAWLSGVLGLPAVLMGWCAAWALLSKLFQHRFDFMGHLRIALPWALAVTVIDLLLPQVGAAFGAAWLWQIATPLKLLLGAFWLYAHLAHVLPQHRRAVQAGVLAMSLVGGGVSLNATWKSRDSLLAAPYMSTLPLPALRLQAAGAPAELVQAMAALGPPLARRAKEARADDRDSGEPEDGDQD
jgi:hypothetical protein